MCLIVFAYKTHPQYKLILAANRDEYYDRPTIAAHWWEHHPDMLAGKDIKAGGTWLGVTKTGKLSALTNYRDPAAEEKETLSRGLLVRNFLAGKIGSEEYMIRLSEFADKYNGFNFLCGTIDKLHYFSNKGDGIYEVGPGIYGISNHLIDSLWPKVIKGKDFLKDLAGSDNISTEAIFSMLKETEIYPDNELPDTGVGIELERILSAVFIKSPDYGTRSSTVILVDNNNNCFFEERSFIPAQETIRHEFTITE